MPRIQNEEKEVSGGPMSEAIYLVLVVDPDRAVSEEVSKALEGMPVAVLRASDRAEGATFCRGLLVNMVILNTSLDDPREPLHDLFAGDSALDIVLIADDKNRVSVLDAIARGASEILTKPLDAPRLRQIVSGCLEQIETRRRTQKLDNELLGAYQFQGIVGRSPAMLQVFARVRRIAPLFKTALVTGPTGTGKELIARALHNLSPRSQGKFVVCNCSALVESLLESQLFGYVKGAFTGAGQDKPGLFEYANHGTLFLDEIGELPQSAQAKLLRILQSQELQRVGSPMTHTVDVHVIAATNRNLRDLVAEGKFREDLFYRLSMIEVDLPPLTDRKEDIPLLERHFLQLFSTKYGKSLRGISRRAQVVLARYPWPGNVRELENVIGNACIMAQTEVLGELDFPEAIRTQTAKPDSGDPGLITLEELQARHLEYVLNRVDGNKARAAEILGISRASIYAMLARMRHVAPKTNLTA